MSFIKYILELLYIIVFTFFMIIRITGTKENEKIKTVINLIILAIGILIARYLFS